MSRYRNDLLQLSGDYFLVYAGMETDLIGASDSTLSG